MNSYIYENTYQGTAKSIRQLLKDLRIPRKWQHFLRIEQNVLVDGQYRSFNQLIQPGEKLTLNFTHLESNQQTYPPSGKNCQVIYEDEFLLVINKPSHQKTHPNLFETDTALNDCATYLGYSPYIVHRLDMLTSGLLLVAKNPVVVPILNSQLKDKSLRRIYVAQVDHQDPLPDSGTIDLPIGQDPNDQRKRMVTPDGRKAVTHFEKIDDDHLKLELETGRTHQIRVHLASQGWPIVGDPLYNPNYEPGQELALTAIELSFEEPFTLEKKTTKLN
ncbi:MAG: RluA family pseudouridine synthase [Lactobacillus sp.]|nr:RluA family pseudouridine synthase [Lactobacillus sp.]